MRWRTAFGQIQNSGSVPEWPRHDLLLHVEGNSCLGRLRALERTALLHGEVVLLRCAVEHESTMLSVIPQEARSPSQAHPLAVDMLTMQSTNPGEVKRGIMDSVATLWT